jgi:hypothetical protein
LALASQEKNNHARPRFRVGWSVDRDSDVVENSSLTHARPVGSENRWRVAICTSNEFEVRPTYSTSNVTLVRPATSYGTTALICEATEISGAYALIPQEVDLYAAESLRDIPILIEL